MPADPDEQAKLVRLLAERFHRRYRSPRLFNRKDPLAELVFIVLSAQTSETKYRRAYRELRAKLPTWKRVAEASDEELATILRPAGLARTKSAQIKAILARVKADQGTYTLRSLKQMSDIEAEAYLTSLPGVGIKTARCVLLFSLDRSVLPVDVHVFRVLGRVGVHDHTDPKDAKKKQVADVLQEGIPEQLRFGLHVNTVTHGRRLCRMKQPLCGGCFLNDICRFARGNVNDGSGSLVENPERTCPAPTVDTL